MPNPNRDDHHDVLDELRTEITTAEHPQARAAAVRGLGALRTPAECFREALYVCAGISLVRSALADPAPIVRAAAVEVLYEHCCARDAATARALYELITTDEGSQLRQTAFMALSACSHKGFRTWPESPEAIAWLLDYVAADPFDGSRRDPLMLLADFIEVTEVRALLGEIAEQHPDEQVRDNVVARLWFAHHHDDTRAVCRRLAYGDPSHQVRARAVKALGWWGEASDDSAPVGDAELLRDLDILRDRAVNDPDSIVRGSAWEQLVAHTDLADVADLLRGRAADDPDPDVRAELLVEIVDEAQHLDDRTPAAAYLAERVERDEDLGVRQLAAELLTDLTSSDGYIHKRLVGTRYLSYYI